MGSKSQNQQFDASVVTAFTDIGSVATVKELDSRILKATTINLNSRMDRQGTRLHMRLTEAKK